MKAARRSRPGDFLKGHPSSTHPRAALYARRAFVFQLALDLHSPEVLDWPLTAIAEWEGFYRYRAYLAEEANQKK